MVHRVREGLVVGAGQRLRHVLREQMHRVVAAAAPSAECGDLLRVAVRIRVPHGEHADHGRGEPDGAGRVGVVGGTGLHGQVMPDGQGLGGGAVLHGAGHRLGDQRGVVRVEHLRGVGRRLVDVLAVGVLDGGHDVDVRTVALVGDGGVHARHILGGQRVVAQNREGVGAVQRVAFGARLLGYLGDALGAELGLHIHIDGVQRLRRGRVQVHVAVAHIAEVADRVGDAVELARRVAVEYGVQVHALLDGAQQRHRLHGGADLIHRLRGLVELLGQVVLARVHGDDRPVLGIDGDAAELHAVGDDVLHAVLRGADHRVHEILLGFVDGGDDGIAAGVQLFGAERAVAGQLVAHHLQQVAVRPLIGVLLRVLDGLRELGLLLLLRGDVAVLLHDAQHARESGLRLFGIDGRIPGRRGGDDAGEHGRLGYGQVLGFLAEVGLGRGLDAIGAASQIDGVHVVAQDLVLVLRLRDLEGQDGLARLAEV